MGRDAISIGTQTNLFLLITTNPRKMANPTPKQIFLDNTATLPHHMEAVTAHGIQAYVDEFESLTAVTAADNKVHLPACTLPRVMCILWSHKRTVVLDEMMERMPLGK